MTTITTTAVTNITNQTVEMYGTYNYDELNIQNSTINIKPYDGTVDTGTLVINANVITIDTASTINGNACGYRINEGPGKGSSNTGMTGGGGGAYGGAGGGGAIYLGGTLAGGTPYGTLSASDISMGSGGGTGYNHQGTTGVGGGLVVINAQDITISGRIYVNGGNNDIGGGGSGGGILITGTNVDISTATLTANGGNTSSASNVGGGGGGGRIKFFIDNASTLSSNITVSGGTSSTPSIYKGTDGLAGTIYIPSSVAIFNTFPSGATIILDGVEQIQKTNAQFDLLVGTHTYTLRLACHEDITGQISVTTSFPATVNGSFVKNTGDISIISNPTGANVYFGTTLQGQTPLNYTCYPEGARNYYISMPGYQTFAGSISIIRNLVAEVNAELVPVGPPGLGSIYITSNPSGANVFIDSIEQTGKITPTAITDITTGLHNIQLRKTGYVPSTSSVTVVSNQTSVLMLSLNPVIDICSFIISKGGWQNMAVFDIMTLVSAYLGQTNLGFPVTIAHIMGNVAYYLDNMPSGNSLTGCTFV